MKVIHAQTPGHSDWPDMGGWLVGCLLVLDRKEGGSARQEEARGIADAVGLDWDAMVARAAQFPLHPVSQENDAG